MDGQAKTKLLLVDDERLLLDIYVKNFQDSGYETTSFTMAEEALAQLRAGATPDVVFFDINMPGMSGFQFLETVKREHLVPKALLLALTNESQDGEKNRIVELGADGHFIKSQLSPSDIVTAVSELLKKRVA